MLQVQAYLWTEEQALFMEINNVDKFVDYMLSDKKNEHNKIGIITIEKIGQVNLKYFESEKIHSFIRSYNEYISN